MAIWQNPTDNALYDDMDGTAIGLPSWPANMVEMTDEQVAAARAPTLDQAKESQIAILKAAYKAAVNQPVAFTNAAGVASTYPSGNTLAENSQTATQNLSDVLTPGPGAWALGKWLDTNNVAQTFTFADLQGLAAAMEAVQIIDWQDLIAKIAEVQAATTVAAVQAVAF